MLKTEGMMINHIIYIQHIVIDPNDGGLKDAMDENDNIIIIDSTLCLLLTPQLKQIYA